MNDQSVRENYQFVLNFKSIEIASMCSDAEQTQKIDPQNMFIIKSPKWITLFLNYNKKFSWYERTCRPTYWCIFNTTNVDFRTHTHTYATHYHNFIIQHSSTTQHIVNFCEYNKKNTQTSMLYFCNPTKIGLSICGLSTLIG